VVLVPVARTRLVIVASLFGAWGGDRAPQHVNGFSLAIK